MHGLQPSTLFFFATQVAAGTTMGLLVVPLAEIGRRFFVLVSLIALVFAALGILVGGLGTGFLHLSFAGLLILYNIILPDQSRSDVSGRRATSGDRRRHRNRLSQLVLALAALCATTALVADAVNYVPSLKLSVRQGPWLAVAFLSSALLLGSSLVALVLGHWYLVLKQASFEPLARATLLVMVALVARTAATGASVCFQEERWQALLEAGWVRFFIDPGIFLLTRGIFGFLAPAVLAWMAWQCVRIRSNQSATGILYVSLAFIIIGEIIAKYFLVSEGLLI